MELDQPIAQPVQRVRLTFSKEGATRYISHLDLARALERALNRAGLPIAYTQGFNRRPRLSLAAALPLGYTSEAEMADVWLTGSVAPEVFLARLREKMPPGVDVTAAVNVPLDESSIQLQIAQSVYRVQFLDVVDGESLRERVAVALAAEALPWERQRRDGSRPKRIDLRPLIVAMEAQDGEDGEPRLLLTLVQTATQTGRPDDVLGAIGYDPLDARIHRVALRTTAAAPHLPEP